MKLFKNFIFLVATLFLFAGCQKEYSVETGNAGAPAKGTLKDAAGNCQPFLANGNYLTDSTLTDSNYVLVQVNITTPGTYKIFTDLQNGFSFQDSGYIGSAGLQTIKLKGSGRPILPIATDFLVTFDTTYCLFSITVGQGTGGGGTTGAFTLSATAGNCSNATPQGTYTTGTALNASNFILLNVNVTALGNWSVVTNSVNGIRFAGAGSFTALGAQTIQLTAIGTPTTAGNTTIPVTAGTSACSFVVNVLQGTGGGGTDPNLNDSAWSFTQGAGFFHGPFEFAKDTTIAGFGYGVILAGTTSATGDSLITIGLLFPSGSITPGTYNTSTLFAAFYFEDYKDPLNAKDIFIADNSTAGVNTAVTIVYNPTTKVITGTFTGTAKNAANANVNITGGKFTARLQ